MIPPGISAHNGAGGIPTDAIRLQPLFLNSRVEIAAYISIKRNHNIPSKSSKSLKPFLYLVDFDGFDDLDDLDGSHPHISYASAASVFVLNTRSSTPMDSLTP